MENFTDLIQVVSADQKITDHRKQCWKGSEDILLRWTKGDLNLCKLFLEGIFLACSESSVLMDILQLTYSITIPVLCNLHYEKCFPVFCLTLPCTALRSFGVLFLVNKCAQICWTFLWFLNVFLYHNLHLDLTSVKKALPNQSVIPCGPWESLSPWKSRSAFRGKHPWLRTHFGCFIDSWAVWKNSLWFISGGLTNQLMFKHFLHKRDVWLGII